MSIFQPVGWRNFHTWKPRPIWKSDFHMGHVEIWFLVISAVSDFTNFLKMYGNLSMAIAYTNSYRNSNLRVVICLFVTYGGKSFIIHDLLDLKFSYRIESKQEGGLPISTVEWGHSLEHFSKINLIFRRGRKIIRSLVLQRKWWFWRLWSQEDS